MSALKFTPGPWEWSVARTMRHLGSTDDTGRFNGLGISAALPTNRLYAPEARERADANAHLIAAAPDLYAALERALTRCHNCDTGGTCSECERDLAAFAKARGETP